MTTCPTPGRSAFIALGELYSSIRISVLTSEWRESCSAEVFGEILHPRLDRGEVIIDPARFVADPDKARHFPELPYVTLRLAYHGVRLFQRRSRACDRPCRAPGVLSPRLPARDRSPSRACFPGLLKPVGLMAANFPAMREKVFERYPMMRSTAFERRMLFERAGERPSDRRWTSVAPSIEPNLDRSDAPERPAGDIGPRTAHPVASPEPPSPAR